jgi:hypothetical protein
MATKSISSSRRFGRRGKEKCGAHNNEEGGQGQPCPLREAIAAVKRGDHQGASPILSEWLDDPEVRRQHELFTEIQHNRGRQAPCLPSQLLPPPF